MQMAPARHFLSSAMYEGSEKEVGTITCLKTGPHIMVVGGDQAFYDGYPKAADPDTSVPYVMWAGTPYQHLMAPVK
jgi:hypothetical protein